MRRLRLLFFVLLLASCGTPSEAAVPQGTPTTGQASRPLPTPAAKFTPLPTRPPYYPGELVDYKAQDGDTLSGLAAHFNTTVPEIRTANPIIPEDVSTLPPGLPMKIPIYYLPFWGTPYHIIPDSLFVNGPAQVGFNTTDFVNAHPGWLKSYSEQISDGPHTGAELVDIVAMDFSVSPRLLLAILDYQAGALTDPNPPATPYVLNYNDQFHQGVYLQLVYAANILNNGYYGWRLGSLKQFDHPDGRIERPDPWQNAATVAIQYYFSQFYSSPMYNQMVGPGGLAQTYAALFGDPWQNVQTLIPGSLQQPPLLFPFEPGQPWNFTGGPHTGWGVGEPFAALDFAPSGVSACNPTTEWVVAMADGVIARSDPAMVILDLDGDGHEQTGWTIFYLHISNNGRIAQGVRVKAGDHIGHPSCQGGEATGTHVHIARKYNGEWVLAGSGALPYDLEGWTVHDGGAAYLGTMTRSTNTITASNKGESQSLVEADSPK